MFCCDECFHYCLVVMCAICEGPTYPVFYRLYSQAFGWSGADTRLLSWALWITFIVGQWGYLCVVTFSNLQTCICSSKLAWWSRWLFVVDPVLELNGYCFDLYLPHALLIFLLLSMNCAYTKSCCLCCAASFTSVFIISYTLLSPPSWT